MACASKGRKRLKKARLDASQQLIKSFFVKAKQESDVNSCSAGARANLKPLPVTFRRASEVYLKDIDAKKKPVPKKQTLLAPFVKKSAPKSLKLKVKKMSRENAELNIKSCGSEPDSDIYEFNSQEELKRIEACFVDEFYAQDSSETDTNNAFGLFGVSSSEDEELGNYFEHEMAELNRHYFDEVPDEILENIFSQLPLVDLLVNLSVVCKRWYNIISCPNFLPWKKKYYRYKLAHDKEGREEIQNILQKECLNDMKMFPVHLMTFLVKFRVVHKENSSLCESLKKHSKYPLIEKFQAEFSQQDKQSCWSTIGLLTLVSSSVYDIQEIIRCLADTPLALMHVIECLYCLAVIYFALMEAQPSKYSSFHYRIYYALYLYENSSHCNHSSLASALGANTSGQQCILKYRDSTDSTWMTHEQVRIMNHNTKFGDTLKIVAFAGTGKTTTLVEYTKLRPSWRFLNVAYNKSVQEQAVRKFPTNVVSRTVHSLAFREVGCKYKRKLATSIHVKNIMENLSESDKGSRFLHAKQVSCTLEAFIASSDPVITSEHVPYQQPSNLDSEHDRKKMEYFNSDKYRKVVVNDAKSIWSKMSDRMNMDVRITHDGYLKVYQLSKPVISSYDCILIDEAQDCTPAVADILLSQDVAKILVGDPHQQIYGFRGATNAMASITESHTYYLTQSFRFGPEIASIASSLLEILKGVRRQTIVGINRQGGFHGDQHGQLAVICRTNFNLFNSAVAACRGENKTRISFAGGINGYNLERILDIYRLQSGSMRIDIKDKFIKMFKSFVELKQYAQKAPDPELMGKIKIVETHHVNIPSHIETIRKHYCSDVDQADIVFSTAHKSKGLEFDTVRVGEDFFSEIRFQSYDQMPTDEKNLLYVAVTRAKHRLQLPTGLYHLLEKHTDLLFEFESLDAVKDASKTFCAECKRRCDFQTSYVVVQRQLVTLATNQKMDGGFVCSTCALKNAPLLGNLLVRTQEISEG